MNYTKPKVSTLGDVKTIEFNGSTKPRQLPLEFGLPMAPAYDLDE